MYCIYLRKSRADADLEKLGEGETLARHRRTLTELAERGGYAIGEVYEEIVSGETLAARPQMQRLLSDVEGGRWQGVLVMELERLARGNSIDQGIVMQTFTVTGTLIITPAKVYNPREELDEEYLEFGLFMSRREYKTINRRLKAGMYASVKEGNWIHHSTPFGYDRQRLEKGKGNALCENVKPLTGDKNRDYAIKFLNAALVDTLGMGITIYGNMIFKGTEFMTRRIDHKGDNESGYWFVCSGEQAVAAVQKIYATMPETVSETYAHNIGRLFCETLTQI